ncbi:hypothetical protein C7T94_17340 [Pedobacter yulinensis]|uniref:Uncharacterized protein n=1 Tax=Pedobacter yulinensis TaxID=2126353 RepID=A0A2T3HHP0_9SPHI|nr:tetratricopeptide repeat protein [Pedobacter yulinensis]PST81952.1 hypothetical protein C7T94_17340 [Pedobacter yulinensis]
MQKELKEETYNLILELSEIGNALADQDDFNGARAKFEEALALLPEPYTDWEAALWLYASIGDMAFLSARYDDAADALQSALVCEEGITNPFVQLRLGQSLFELGAHDAAVEHLLRAYMLEGSEIFDSEDPKYFHYLKTQVKDIN